MPELPDILAYLMIAGRLHWKPPRAKIPGRTGLAAFDFGEGTLLLTAAGSTRRASLHLVAGEAAADGFPERVTAFRDGMALEERDTTRRTAAAGR